MKLRRKEPIREMLRRMEHRRTLLAARCVMGLTADSGLAEVTAQALVVKWGDLVVVFAEAEEAQLAQQAMDLGAWCAAQAIPFEAVMAQLHYYKEAAMPLLVREYNGVEGYLEAHLALDELLTWLMGKIPVGYFGARREAKECE